MTDRGDPISELNRAAAKIRLDVVKMIGPENRGHFGGSLSAADIIAALYFSVLNIEPARPDWSGRDRFILSKGHACPALYAALARRGYFPAEELMTLKNIGSRLQGHPDRTKLPGLDANTGSLGQGLSQGIGMALALNADAIQARVFVLLGDGELNEGQVWEAVMFAGARRLYNLIAIVDQNHLQAMGATRDRLDIGELEPKFAAFGWHVIRADGHDMHSLLAAFAAARQTEQKPAVILAETIKGRGLSCAENAVDFHNGLLTREQYQEAMECLQARTEVP
ncbi:MAG TPA: transketolase [Clostridiales bacterium]|nr:transketolase [Clostridiales bacterium]